MGTKDKKMMKKKQEEIVSATTRSSRGGGGGGKKMMITDARFSSLHSDPRFQNVPKQQSKVTIDSRFDKMFTDKSFSSSSARIDKRGKAKDPNSENSLPRYYNLEKKEEEEDLNNKKESKSDDDEDETETEEEEIKLQDVHESDSETTTDSEDDDLKNPIDDEHDDTSSTNSDTDDEEDDVYSDQEPEEPEENIPLIEQETHRLAIVNMDWSQVRAVDLYVLMSSFLPKTGHVLSVAVYPSEFGLKRMEEEAVRGPVGIFEEKSDEDEDEDDDGDDNDEIDETKLRAYEKSRLRYYYAVVECDSSATADYLYKTCDGTEFERSSNKLDLRFIPDSMEFKHPPRDVATEAPAKYEGLDFHTRALQHSKIHLTWDEDEPIRAKTLKRKFDADQLAELELKEFLASDDGESDEDGDAKAADGQSEKKLDKWDKYRALIQAGDGSDEGEDEEDAKDMEVTFNTGLEDISKRILEKKDKESETVWEAYLRKKSEKKKARKNRSKNSSEDESSDSDREIPEEVDDFFLEEPSGKAGKTGKANRKEKQLEDVEKEQEASRAELELLLADDQDADHNVKGYKIKPKKAKGKKGKEVPSEDKIPVADYNDPRFSALFSSHLFALDPTDPQYKRSAAYARQMAQKHKNGVREERSDAEAQLQAAADDTGPKKDEELQSDSISLKKNKHELSSLVRSLKNKSEQVKILPMQKDPKKLKTARQPITESNNKNDELSSMIQSLKKKSRR